MRQAWLFANLRKNVTRIVQFASMVCVRGRAPSPFGSRRHCGVLLGACAGCQMKTMTLKEAMEPFLKQHLPWCKGLRAAAG